MQRTPRDEHPLRTKLTTGAVVALSGLLIAGAAVEMSENQQVEARAVEAATSYRPTTAYTPPPSPPEVAFIGDSFTFGSGASGRGNRWTSLVANEQGWLELNYGVAGTGYGTAGSLAIGRAYADRLTDVIMSQPDVVIVSTAGNGITVDQSQAIRDTFETLQEELPDAELYATPPYTRDGPYPNVLTELGEDIEAGVEAVGGEYLDLGHPLGGHPEAMDDDEVHPNDVGHRIIADAVLAELSE